MAKRVIMAVGAHADDIELNIGGTVLKYLERGYELVYVMSTNNMSGRWNHIRPDGVRDGRLPPYFEIQPQRKKEAAAAAAFFGTTAIHLDHPQRHYTRADGSRAEVCYGGDRPDCVKENEPTILTAHEHPALVKRLADLILEKDPEIVLTHSPVMVDMEHTTTCLLVAKAYTMAVESGYTGMMANWLDIACGTPILYYGRTFSRWDSFVDVTKYWARKLDTVKFHACQIPDPSRMEFPDWGPACGCGYAECFTVAHWGKQPHYTAGLAAELAANQR